MQPPPKSNHRFWYQKPQVWIAISIAGCVVFLAMPHVRRTYHRWTGEKKVQRAREALKRGDYDAAVLNARGALATNQKDVEATRVMAMTAEAAGATAPAIQFRRQLEALKPGDAENLLALAENYLKAGDSSAAVEVVKSLAEADRHSANYHDVLSAISWTRGESSEALTHAAEASKLAPSNDNYRLRFATIALTSTALESRTEAMAALEQLSTKAETRLVALRTLLGNAMSQNQREKARKLADALAASPGATFTDELTQLSTLNALRVPDPGSATRILPAQDAEFFDLLGKFQQSAAENPKEIFELVNWMNANHLALMVEEWVDKLPVPVRSKPPVCVAVADSYARASNWKRVKEVTENGTWNENEYVRLAMLARALDRLQDEGGSTVAWNAALRESEKQPTAPQRLAREAMNWGWLQRAEELLWKLTEADPCPRWVADSLWKFAEKKRDADALCKIAKIILTAEPKSVRARNSYVSFLLLTEQEPVASHSMAEALYIDHPEDIAVAASYAYSLYLRGRPWEAISVLETFPTEGLRQPWLAFQYSTFLAAAGEFDRAEEYLRLSTATEKFPKQQALADLLLAAFDTRVAEQNANTAEAASSWKAAVSRAGDSTAWLEMLGQMALKWDWKERLDEVVTKLAELDHCPAWAQEVLWTATLKGGNASRIYKAAKLIMTSNPTSLSARSKFIRIALLSKNEADAPHRLAEALANENPGKPEAVTVYGFSLYRQGKNDQAVSAFKKLQPDQLREPQTAFYYAIVLAAAGQPDQAQEYLAIGAARELLPEEKVISDVLNKAFRWHASTREGDPASADATWKEALFAAGPRTDLLESLARAAMKWDAPERAEEAFWKLSEYPDCPRWALDSLWATAEKKRDSVQLYKVSRLLRKLDPNDIVAKNNFVWLSLLTGQDAESPHRQAESLRSENPGDANIAITYALSLYQQGKVKEAAASLSSLRPEQLRAARPAFYFGVFLASTGETVKAKEYLDLGSKVPLLPEEQALLTKIRKVE